MDDEEQKASSPSPVVAKEDSKFWWVPDPDDGRNDGKSSTSKWDWWVDHASVVIVRRPKLILACMAAFCVVVLVGLAAGGVEVSQQTAYDWDVEGSVFTARRDMVEASVDRTDAAPLGERSDLTYWWNFYYDTESYEGDDSCDAPRGLFTPRNVRLVCETERALLRRSYATKYCVLAADGTCAPLAYSLAGFFYGADAAALANSSCPLLADDAVDAVAEAMYADRAAYGAFLDSGAFDRGYACRGRSYFPYATPLAGEDDIGELADAQFDAVWIPKLQPDFNVRVLERFGPDSLAVLRELDESNRFAQKSAESTLI